MKKFKKFLFGLLIFSAVLLIILFFYVLHLKPKYDGSVSLGNIEKESTVYFDEYGVPHIYAGSEKDALTTLGYVHAQDRLWQMELLRRIAPGRLSEIFGTKAVKNDRFFAGIGIEEASAKAIANLDKASPCYQLAFAYIDGINQFLEEGPTPIEFQLLGIQKQKFTLIDVYNIFGYMSFSFAMAQKTDPLLTSLRDEFGMAYMEDFGIDGAFNTTQLKNFNGSDYIAIAKSLTALLENSPIPPFVGSNSWVLGPQKTRNGKVILANDPHIGFSQPGTWYEAHISTPNHEIYGFYLAGTPFPLMGHNRNYAYGLTMFENDDIDFFKEEVNPKNQNQYKTAEGWKSFEVRSKSIIVKDSASIALQIKSSQHGPLMNGLLDGLPNKSPVAMSWIYTEQPLHILEAVYGISHAKSFTDFKSAVGLIAAPGLNVMYGDAKGNIGWITSGKLYKKATTVNTNFILDGTNSIDVAKEFFDFSKNPSAVNPPWHYVYSANNQPEAIDGYSYPGYYLPEDRAKRIDQLLSKGTIWTKASAAKMITDNTSSVAPKIVKNLLLEVNETALSSMEKQAFSVMKLWSGNNNLNDIAPTIYNKWIYRTLKNTFADEMGEERFRIFLGTHLMKQVIAPMSANSSSVWWDNVSSKNTKETKQDIISKSFKEAIAELEKQLGTSIEEWKWAKVHTLEHGHPLGSVAALRNYFNVGPFPIDGSNDVINNQFFDFSENGKYTVKGGPSTRRIIDFSDIENSWSILPTGQSGNQLSKHYSDQAAMYAAGKFRKMKLNENEIIATSSKLVIHPKGNDQ